MRRPAVAAAVALVALVTVPAQAQRQSVVSVSDARGDANGYWYVDPDHEVNGPVNSATSDPRYDIVRLTAVATTKGVQLTVRLAEPIADAGESVWVGLTQLESKCTLFVRVSDYVDNGRAMTELSNWCGSGATVNSVRRYDTADARQDMPTAFVPYTAFPGTLSGRSVVQVRAEVMRDAGGATVQLARITLDGVTATPRLRLLQGA